MAKLYKYKYVADAYKQLLFDLNTNYEYISEPRGQKIKEITNVVIEIEEPCFNLYKNKRRSSPRQYICAELIWYFTGTNTIEFISKYAKMWDAIKNQDGTVNSAYGNLLFREINLHNLTQYEWALQSLIRDKDTRQAFMHFNKPKHQYFENKDQVCTLFGLFNIRNNKLNFTIDMRSNDAILGFMTDFAFFNILHQQMFLHLKTYYSELIMGSYTHISNSMHIYEKHFDLVQDMLNYDFEKDKLPLLDINLVDENGKTLLEKNRINDNFIDFLYKGISY